jgi:endo-1,4-beta-mannosidase
MDYVFGARGSVSPMRARGIREAGERFFVRLFVKTPPLAKLISDNENSRWEIIFVVDYKTNHIYIYTKNLHICKKNRYQTPVFKSFADGGFGAGLSA